MITKTGKYNQFLQEDVDADTADLYIFGDIVTSVSTGIDEAYGEDFGDASSLSIAKDLASITAKNLNVHINSLGGYTNEGLAIFNLLRSCGKTVTTFCDGFACSAASIIFMAGSRRVMGAASMLMIHNAWTSVSGNAVQLEQQAEWLKKVSAEAANAYIAGGVTITREELDAMLDGEDHDGTWISSDEAVEYGFATEKADEEETEAPQQSAMKSLCNLISRMRVHDQNDISGRLSAILGKLDTIEKQLTPVVLPQQTLEPVKPTLSDIFHKKEN